MSRRQDILDVIERNPGATGATIYLDLAARYRAAKWFGEDSLMAMIFSPSIGGIYVHLAALESTGQVYSEWGLGIGDKPRRRHYYARQKDEQQ